MNIISDFRDLLRCLYEEQVRYLIIGAYAVMAYTEPRFTKDLDIWFEAEPDNAAGVLRALKKFGAPTNEVTVNDLLDASSVYQIGVAPVRVDFLSSLPGVKFSEAWPRRSNLPIQDFMTFVIGKEDLILAKVAAGRKQDKDDLRRLRKPR